MNEDLKRLIDKASEEAVETKRYLISKRNNDLHLMLERALERNEEVREILELVNYAISKGYRVQNYSPSTWDCSKREAPRLCTDGIEHGLGLYGKPLMAIVKPNFKFSCIGIKNGGINGDNDIIADGYGIYWGSDEDGWYSYSLYDHNSKAWELAYKNLESYLSQFDAFKEKVMEFIKNINSYKCFL